MSKVVKKVGKAIGKVVKGVVKGVKKVVKKISKSKFFKVIATAALVYFGGAALMGGFSTIGTSTSFLQGMSTGLSNAWAGITGATSSALGGNFAQAGSQLAAGAKGAAFNPVTGVTTNAAQTIAAKTAAANTTSAQALANAQGALANPGTLTPSQLAQQAGGGGLNLNTATSGQMLTKAQTPLSSVGSTPLSTAGAATPPVNAGSMVVTAPNQTVSQLASQPQGVPLNVSQTLAQNAPVTTPPPPPPPAPSSGGLLSGQYTKPALIMTGGQMISGYAQGKAQEEMMEQQRRDEEARMLAYGQNVGTYIGMPTYNPYTGKYEYANQSPALTYDEYGNVDIYQSGTGG